MAVYIVLLVCMLYTQIKCHIYFLAVFKSKSKSIPPSNSDNSASLYLDKKDSMIYNKGNISTVTPNGAQINRGLSKQEKFSGKIQRESTAI